MSGHALPDAWRNCCHSCTGTGLRSPLPHLHRDWARPVPPLHRDWTALTAATSAPGLRWAGLCQELREEIAALQAQLASLDKQSVEREIELKREKFELKSKLEKMCALAIAAHHASCASQSVA